MCQCLSYLLGDAERSSLVLCCPIRRYAYVMCLDDALFILLFRFYDFKNIIHVILYHGLLLVRKRVLEENKSKRGEKILRKLRRLPRWFPLIGHFNAQARITKRYDKSMWFPMRRFLSLFRRLPIGCLFKLLFAIAYILHANW